MRRLLFLAAVALLGLPAGAEVIRCADAAGKVSYTDGACPSGARQVGRVAEPAPSVPRAPAIATPRPLPPPREAGDLAAQPAPQPSGPIVIDPRAAANTTTDSSSRWSDRRGGDDPAVADYGYPYPGGYPGYRPPAPPRDMRPRIRNCDAGGCQDTQGNRYDRSGQLSNYRGIDGRTCQVVGTTQVCR
ncbi:MAG: DUF4124 domain-containing protein [Variovorax sp.]